MSQNALEREMKGKEDDKEERVGGAEPPQIPKENIANTQISIRALGRKMELMAELFFF